MVHQIIHSFFFRLRPLRIITLSLEKKHQDECYRTFNQLGWCKKWIQDTVLCKRCGNPVHPVNKGYPDYHGELNSKPFNIPIKIECKGGEDRIEFRDIRVDQRHWLDKYAKYGGIGFIWLQLGTERVNAKSDKSRRVWLIPYGYFLSSMVLMRKSYGFKYIPLKLESEMRLKDPTMTANFLYSQYTMEWIPVKEYWRPNKQHPIWNLPLEISYAQFDGE